MTDEQTVELLISPIREYISKVEAEAARFSDIAATIRVNALRRGASEDQIQALLTGEQSFIEWAMKEIESPNTSAMLAEAEARGRKEAADHACAVIDAHSEYDENACCDGRECCCGGESVHEHMKARIQALIAQLRPP